VSQHGSKWPVVLSLNLYSVKLLPVVSHESPNLEHAVQGRLSPFEALPTVLVLKTTNGLSSDSFANQKFEAAFADSSSVSPAS
jgi:hypothetical protein